MVNTRVARRYALSLLDLAQERGEAEKIFKDLELLEKTLNENRELRALLKNPVINEDKKNNILNEIFGGKISKLTHTFIVLIVKKKRESNLLSIATEYVRQYKELKGITTAIISTAAGLDDNLRSKVINLIRNDERSEVELVERVNPGLIGGFILRYDNFQYDTSVSRSLRGLKRTFSKNLYIGKIKNK